MNLKRITGSLVTRLIAAALLLVIFSRVAGYFLLTMFLHEDLTQVVSMQQMALAKYVAYDVDYKLTERRRFLEQLATILPQELLAQPARLGDWLKERHELEPLFSLGLMVADAQGKVLIDFPTLPGRTGFSIVDNPDFLTARDGQSVIGRPLTGPISKQPILPMAAPVKDRAGHVTAVLIGTAELSAKGFLDHLLEAHIGESGGILLVAPRDKLFVAATDPTMVLKPTPATGVNVLHDRAMQGFRGSGTTINARGIEEISAIASVPSTGWFVIARLPAAEALATVARVQAFTIRQSVVGMIVVILIYGFLFTWLLRPLHRAANQAEKMTRGEIPLAPLPVLREDELGHLTAAFNRLLAKLGRNQVELLRMANHDPLTGLPNRKLLADRMQQALARAQRNSTQLAVLFLDLNGFKLINDTLGHEAGDEALKEIARRLLMVVRQADTLARLGGDEFILLATDLEKPAENAVRTLAEKCIEVVAQPLHLHGTDRVLGVAIGIAVSGGVGDPDRLLGAADQAMYEAKQKNHGGYVMAAPH